MPFQRSRCWFSPELWCDLFDASSPDAAIKFLCEIVPGTLTAILRPAPIYDGTEQSKIYNLIRRVWGDRQVGFQCYRNDDDAWTLKQPCLACENIRNSQVVIVDLNDNSSRAFSYLTLAARSEETLQQLRLFTFNFTIPQKKLILINKGRDRLPPHIKTAYTFINYAENDLLKEMSRLASTAMVFREDESPISISFEDLGGSAVKGTDSGKDEENIHLIGLGQEINPQLSRQEDSQADDTEQDIPILILTEEIIPDEPENDPKIRLENIVDELEEKLQDVENIEDSQVTERIEELIKQHKHYTALQVLCAKTFKNPEWERYRRSMVWQCLNAMQSIETVRFFFDMISPVSGKELVMEWQAEDPPSGILTVNDASLTEHIKITQVPLRIYNHLTAQHIDECYAQVISQFEEREIPVLLIRETWEEFPVGLQIIKYKEGNLQDGKAAVHFIQLALSDIKKRIADGNGLEYFREQVKSHYSRVDDLYREGLTRDVFKDGEFFGRQVLIKEVISHINSGDKFFISGLRRSGKTSLLKRLLLVNHLDDHLMVYVSFERMGNVPKNALKEVYLFLLQQLRAALREKYPPQRYSGEKYSMLQFDDIKIFNFGSETSLRTIQRHFVEDIDHLLTHMQQEKTLRFRKLVLLLDEIELLLPDHKHPDGRCVAGVKGHADFLRQLRELSSSQNGTVVLGLVGFGSLLQLVLRDYDNPIFDQFEEKPLGMLTKPECHDLVSTIGTRMLVFYSPESLHAIFQATGGDPQITKYLCSIIFQERGSRPGGVELPDVTKGVTRFLALGKYRNRISSIFNRFSPYFQEEAELLRQIACSTDTNIPVSYSQITSLCSLDTVLENLRNYGLLRQETSDQYVISMGLLHHWLKNEMTESSQ